MGSQVLTMAGEILGHLMLMVLLPLCQADDEFHMGQRRVAVMNQWNMFNEVDSIKMDSEVADRNMQQWWGDYNSSLEIYKSGRNTTSICSDTATLIDLLRDFKETMQMVRNGWILKNPDYANFTDLHLALGEYITEQEVQATAEDARLTADEHYVALEENLYAINPCPCKWSDWQEWSECSATCGSGVTSRNRTVVQNATNNGQECVGSNRETDTCHTQYCPIDCEWGEWGEYSQCYPECGNGTATRQRVHTILAQYGGANCTGDEQEERECNLMEDLEAKVLEYQGTILNLSQQINNAQSANINLPEPTSKPCFNLMLTSRCKIPMCRYVFYAMKLCKRS